MALRRLRQSGSYRVAGLLTTVARENGHVGMHGVSSALIAEQARSLNLALERVPIPAGANNAAYEAAMAGAFALYRKNSCVTMAFGDLFLEDIRDYRDALLARHGMAALYPVWGENTRTFIEEFVAVGFKAVICSVDLARLDISFAGREINNALLRDLPPTIDPCGENGEFHNFVHGGPDFSFPIVLSMGGAEARGDLGYRELSLA